MQNPHLPTQLTETAPAQPALSEAFMVWLRIGLLSFGGPAGQIALMHRIIVEEKKWLDEARFLHALNFCMLLPGPEAQQLATYIGWLVNKTLGGVLAGVLFILPGAIVILGFSILYALHADLALVSGLFFGLKAAVIAVVFQAVVKIARKALVRKFNIWVACLAFVAIFLFAVPFPLIVAVAGVTGYWAARQYPETVPTAIATKQAAMQAGPAVISFASLRPAAVSLLLWLLPVGLLLGILGPDNVFSQMAVFFSKMAVVTFGGAYAVLAYVAQQAVGSFGWMTTPEMVDGLGLAETTPGPLIMVVQFVGFLGAYRADTGLDPLLAGVLGALIATWVTFAPCFFWIFLGAPFIERLRGASGPAAALSAITAAVVGVIANLAVWFSVHVLFKTVEQFEWGLIKTVVPIMTSFDFVAALLAALAFVFLFRFKINMIIVLMATGLMGTLIALY